MICSACRLDGAHVVISQTYFHPLVKSCPARDAITVKVYNADTIYTVLLLGTIEIFINAYSIQCEILYF